MLAAGTIVHRYRVEGVLGNGGMGTVYIARDTHLDRQVALKLLSMGEAPTDDKDARARLVREARAAAAINHPHAVTIYDAGDSDHGPYIVMELVEGETLRKRVLEASDLASKIAWLRQIAEALAAAHDRGLVHRDVKPENIMVRADDIVKVLDFGIARRVQTDADPSAPTLAPFSTITQGGVPVGTPSYMAPEQLRGERVDSRTDQFAWGVVAYELLGGRLPWRTDGGQLGVVGSILADSPTPIEQLNPDVPPRLAYAISRALSKAPAQRYSDFNALLRSLDGEHAPSKPKPSLAGAVIGGAARGVAAGAAEGAPEAGRRGPKVNAPERIEVASVPPARGAPRREVVSENTMMAAFDQALGAPGAGADAGTAGEGYTAEELDAAAEGVGLAPALLASAVRDVRSSRTDADLKGEILHARRRGFFPHLFAYLGVIGMLVMIIAPRGKHPGWMVPALMWGIGLACHAYAAFNKTVSARDLRRARNRELKELEVQRYRLLKLEEAEAKLQRRRAKESAKNDEGLGDDMRELGGALKRWSKSVVNMAAHEVKQVAEEFEKAAPGKTRTKAEQEAARYRVAEATQRGKPASAPEVDEAAAAEQAAWDEELAERQRKKRGR